LRGERKLTLLIRRGNNFDDFVVIDELDETWMYSIIIPPFYKFATSSSPFRSLISFFLYKFRFLVFRIWE
jgi:hypothetical protein